MTVRWLSTLAHLDRMPEVWRCAQRVHRWWPMTRAYIKLGQTAYPFEFRTWSGVKVELRDFYELTTAWIIFCRDEYVVPREAKTIIDFGANYGAFTLLAAKAAPDAKVVSVEPFPSTFERLTRNVARNMLGDRVRCWPVALAPTNGRVQMTGAEVESHMRRVVLDAAPESGTVAVEALSWRDLLARVRSELRTDRIDLVKMDIEGAEHEVIPDLPADAFDGIQAWQMEYHPNKPKGPLFASLERAGLKCRLDIIYDHDGGVAHFERPRP